MHEVIVHGHGYGKMVLEMLIEIVKGQMEHFWASKDMKDYLNIKVYGYVCTEEGR